MTLEGIVIQIIPQKERDLIARLLLREGTVVSVYVFGGMGGGKNSKPRIFEPGSLLRVEVREARTGRVGGDGLLTASESSVLWQPAHMRHQPVAFALTCLYLELTLKSALPHEGTNPVAAREHAGLFTVLSNGLFYLDEAAGAKELHWPTHLALFLSKFLLHLGLVPDENSCVYCGCELAQEASAPLVIEQGGFSCSACYRESGAPPQAELPVRAGLSQALRLKFSEWRKIQQLPRDATHELLRFWSYHFQVQLADVSSYRLLG